MHSLSRFSLYERVGGFPGLAAIVDDLVERLCAELSLDAHGARSSDDLKRSLRAQSMHLLCTAAGDPGLLLRRPWLDGGAGWGLVGFEWNTFLAQLERSLSRFAVPEDDKREMLSVLASIPHRHVHPRCSHEAAAGHAPA